MNYLSIDTEYTSFYSPDRSKSGELLQLAIIPIINGVPDRSKSFNEYCRPLTGMWNTGAEKVHGITKSRAMTFQHPSEMIKKLCDYLDSFDEVFTCIGYNHTGDKNYIQRNLLDYSCMRSWVFKCLPDWVDVKTMVTNRKHLISKKSLTLSSMCEFFGIKLDFAHDALYDAEATYLVWERVKLLIDPRDGRQSYLESKMTPMEKRRKYLDLKYIAMNGDGSIFITEYATKDKEALRVILDEIWCLFAEHKE